MPLVKAQCTNCGAALEVDPSNEAAVCPYCNTPYIVEKAINNYTTNITNNIQAQNLTIINQSEDKEFEVKGVKLVKYIGSKTDVVIPDYICEIGDDAFKGCDFIKSVTLNKKLKSIGYRAFEKCFELEKVIVENDTDVKKEEQNGYLGFRAFDFCAKLTEVILPARLVYLRKDAFRGCENLQSITCLSNNIEFDLDNSSAIKGIAIEECISLENFNCENVCDNNGNNVIKIEYADNELPRLPDRFFEKNPKFIKVINTSNSTVNTTQTEKSGCYVATCVYGSYDCPQVWTLRRYRDDTLGATWYGRAFIHTYYAVSPTLVKWFGKTKWFKKLWRGTLDRMVKRLNDEGVDNTPYQDRDW